MPRLRRRSRPPEPVAPVAVAAEPEAAEAEAAPAAPKRRSRAKKVVLPVDTDVAIELAVADASAPELVAEESAPPASNADAANEDDGDGRVRAAAGGSAPLAKGRVG